MLTVEQKIDAERLSRYIIREKLSSIMNDTKWQRLYDSLQVIEGRLDFRRKDLRGSEDQAKTWCGDFYMMIGGWREIEWLDIRGQRGMHDDQQLIIKFVRDAAVAYTLHDDFIRIWGYTRPGITPDFQK